MYNFIYTRFDGEFWVDNRVKRRRSDRQEDFLRVEKDSTFPCLCVGWTRECNPAYFCELTPVLGRIL